MKTNKEIANTLHEAWRQGVAVSPIASEMQSQTIENAYAIQSLWMQQKRSSKQPKNWS